MKEDGKAVSLLKKVAASQVLVSALSYPRSLKVPWSGRQVQRREQP